MHSFAQDALPYGRASDTKQKRDQVLESVALLVLEMKQPLNRLVAADKFLGGSP